MLTSQIVVRSAGERSLPLCIQSIKDQGTDFVLVEEAPMIKAFTKTFEIGKNSAKDLLIAIDADIILAKDSLKKMHEETELLLKDIPNLYKLDFPLTDKFLGTCYGCHVYVNKYSEKFYDYFSTISYDPLDSKPEKTNLSKVAEKLNLVERNHFSPVGFHDFEQYYAHIYVKYFRKAIQSASFVPEIIDRILQNRMKKEAEKDLDFAVALFGLYNGSGKTEVYTDARNYPTIDKVFTIQEKAPIILPS